MTMIDRRIKVIMETFTENGVDAKVFVAEGESVTYRRVTEIEQRPALRGAFMPLAWPKKLTTVHTLTWETVDYE